MTTAKIEFPFQRGHPYSIGELKEFEAAVRVARRNDPELGKMLRDPRGTAPAWLHLRNKELIPLMLFADHMGLSDNDAFVLSPEGDAVDAVLVLPRRRLNLQFTLAAPVLGDGHPNSGYLHHQTMAALNEHEIVSGYPPYTSRDGVAEGSVLALTAEDRFRACQNGISAALAKKAPHDGRGCALVVFARTYCEQFQVPEFVRLVEEALRQYRLTFDAVCVLDREPGYFIARPAFIPGFARAGPPC